MSDLPTRHYTSAGRVVYNRKPNRFTWHDARRILNSLPEPGLSDTQDFLDCFQLVNGRLRYQVGLFDLDLVKEFVNNLLQTLISMLGNVGLSRIVDNKLGKRLGDLLGLLWDAIL